MTDIDQSHPDFSRIVHQRLRNRIIEQLQALTEGEDYLGRVGFGEFFEAFFDFAPYDGPQEPNAAFSPAEVASFAAFLRLMQIAIDDTPGEMSNAAFSATGWPGKLAAAAAETLGVFAARGRLNEDMRDDR